MANRSSSTAETYFGKHVEDFGQNIRNLMRNFFGDTKAAILAFLTNFSATAGAYQAKFGLDGAGFTALQAQITSAIAARADADTALAAARAAVASSDAQTNTLVDTLRGYCQLMRFSDMTDAELETLGLNRRSSTNSPTPAPSVAPALAVESLSPGAVLMRFSTPGASGPRMRPPGAVGVEISLLPAASTASPESGVLQSVTRVPQSISTALVAGAVVKAQGRFYTQSGLTGPWSTPVTFAPQPV